MHRIIPAITGGNRSKQVTVSSCSGQIQNQFITIYLINQKPVRCDVALTAILIVSDKVVISVLFWKRLSVCKHLNYNFEQLDVVTTLDDSLEIIFERRFRT